MDNIVTMLRGLAFAAPTILAAVFLLKMIRKSQAGGGKFAFQDHMEEITGIAVLTGGTIAVLEYGLNNIRSANTLQDILITAATVGPFLALGGYLLSLMRSTESFKIEDHLESLAFLSLLAIAASALLNFAVSKLQLGF